MITHFDGYVLSMQHQWQNTQNVGFPGKLVFASLRLFTPDWKEEKEETTIMIREITAISCGKFPACFLGSKVEREKMKGGHRVII